MITIRSAGRWRWVYYLVRVVDNEIAIALLTIALLKKRHSRVRRHRKAYLFAFVLLRRFDRRTAMATEFLRRVMRCIGIALKSNTGVSVAHESRCESLPCARKMLLPRPPLQLVPLVLVLLPLLHALDYLGKCRVVETSRRASVANPFRP